MASWLRIQEYPAPPITLSSAALSMFMALMVSNIMITIRALECLKKDCKRCLSFAKLVISSVKSSKISSSCIVMVSKCPLKVSMVNITSGSQVVDESCGVSLVVRHEVNVRLRLVTDSVFYEKRVGPLLLVERFINSPVQNKVKLVSPNALNCVEL